jgi:cation:H+ antiporter
MDILIQSLILAGGLVMILFGANYLVDGASSIAKKFGISEFIIGLTIVGIGTSTPEMVVSYMSAFNGSTDLAIGNVVGSNILNTLLILGITALISPLAITRDNLRKDIPLNIAVTILLILLGLNKTFFGVGENTLSRLDGMVLLAIFVWYFISSFKSGKGSDDQDDEEGITERKIWVSALMIAGGLAGLVIGGRLFVDSATSLAKILGISEKFIAITIMAAGTSMPELATCIVAARKGRNQMALGNVLGSNIANILMIVGGAALISPLSLQSISIVDLSVIMISSLVLLVSAYTIKKDRIDRREGFIFILIEIAYMIWLFTKG